MKRTHTVVALLATGIALVASVAACGGGKKSDGGAAANSAACKPYAKYKGHSGTVTMYSPVTDPEAGFLQQSWKQFESCTGITIQYTGDKQFETQLKVKVEGGNAPDLAVIPQPGLLKTFVDAGKLKAASPELTALIKKNWNSDWVDYGTVNDKVYASPMGANFKSLVWYSPKQFKAKGYQVPTTWDQMIALSNKIAASGQKPWCVGVESGVATGWPLTDWMEEVMLRLEGPDVYDQWVSHQIPFNDPKVKAVLAKVGQIVKNPKYVNAGIGNVKSIATTAFQKAGLPIESGKCWLHQQASFYTANWDKGTKVAPDGDVFAFYLPPISTTFGKPVEGGGSYLAALSNDPATQAVRLYIASGEWATSVAKVHAGEITANKAVDKSAFTDPVDALSVQRLTDPKATFRFDGSDAMPSAVGSGTFFANMTQWILGTQNDSKTLNNIEKSWPKK